MTEDPLVTRAPHVELLKHLDLDRLQRLPGTVVFVFPLGEIDTDAVLRFIARQSGLPQRLFLARVVPTWSAHVPLDRQAESEALCDGLFVTTLRFGLDDAPDIPLAFARSPAAVLRSPDVTYVVGPETRTPGARDVMTPWRRWLFRLVARPAPPIASYFRLPASCVSPQR